MTGRPRYAVQLFERCDDRILPTVRIAALNQEDCIDAAWTMSDRYESTVALCLTGDEDGNVWTTTILAIVGAVPEGWAESQSG